MIPRRYLPIAPLSRRAFLLGGLVTAAFLPFDRSTLTITRRRIAIPRLPVAFRGFTILHLSDLHCKSYGKGQAELLDLIDRLSFDIVAITGDMITAGQVQLRPTLDLLAGLGGKPVYFVNGNHEWYSGEQEHVDGAFAHAGARVLRNEAERVERGREHLWVAGIEDPVSGRSRLEKALAVIPGSDARILLAHAPLVFPAAVRAEVDLVLAGHTHGGQIRLPLLGAPYVPRLGFFPRWSYGFYRSGATNMVVTSGLGETSVPVRYNARPEVVLVTLDRTKGEEPETDNVAEMLLPLKERLKNLGQRL